MTTEPINAEQVRTEVRHQHELLARWLGSTADPSVLADLRDAHTEDFTMVDTDGQVATRGELLTSLTSAGNSSPGLRILVDDVTVVAELAGAVLTRFLETHVHHGHTTSRRVTALLSADPGAPNGYRWRYVHETPLAEHAS